MKITIIMLLAMACAVLVGCQDQDKMYRDFVVPGGITYPGMPISVKAHAGKNRLQISWLRSRDPRVASARIFWNNNRDSVTLDIPPNLDTIKYVFNDFKEGIYNFFIKTYDVSGNVSVPVEIAGRVLGEQYEQSLLTRGVNSVTIDGDGVVGLEWAAADTVAGAVATEVTYQSTSGTQKTVLFSASDELSTIADYKPGEALRYRTLYLPDALAIDTFYTGYTTTGDFFFKKNKWNIVEFSSEHGGGENTVRNFIDGKNDETRWHAHASNGRYPHFVTIDLGVRKEIASVGVWRTRFDSPGGDDRGPNRMQFFVSDDRENWIDLGIYNFNRFMNGQQLFPLAAPASGRYFKFVGLDGPQNYIVLGELDLYVK